MPQRKPKDTLEDRIVRRTGVMFEALGSQISAVAEGHGQLGRQIGELHDKVEGLEVKVDNLDAKVDGLEGEMNSLRGEMRTGFKRLDEKIDRVENTLGSTLQNHEKRITHLEEKAVL